MSEVSLEFFYSARPNGVYTPRGVRGTFTTNSNAFVHQTVTLGTGGTAIPVGSATLPPALVAIKNTHATASLTLGHTSGLLPADCFGYLPPGGVAVWAPRRAVPIYWKGSAALEAVVMVVGGAVTASTLAPFDPIPRQDPQYASLSLALAAGTTDTPRMAHTWASVDAVANKQDQVRLLSETVGSVNVGRHFTGLLQADAPDGVALYNYGPGSEFAQINPAGVNFFYLPVSAMGGFGYASIGGVEDPRFSLLEVW